MSEISPSPDVKKGNNEKESETSDVSQALQALSLAKSESKEIFIDQYCTSFASISINDHIETLPINDGRFRHWLCKIYFDNYKSILRSEHITNALSVLNAEAEFSDKRKEMSLRVAWHPTEPNTLLYDLSNSNHDAIKISNTCWEKVGNPCIFYRYRNQKAQVIPSRISENLLACWNCILSNFSILPHKLQQQLV